MAVREEAAARERVELHVFDQWCHLGTAATEADLHALLGGATPGGFDTAIYKALSRLFVEVSPKVIELRASGATGDRAGPERA